MLTSVLSLTQALMRCLWKAPPATWVLGRVRLPVQSDIARQLGFLVLREMGQVIPLPTAQ